MAEFKFINGNEAVAYGVKLARAGVVAAYPITPQTKIVEKLSELIADRELEAEFVKVESEHSAMAACLGAASVGARAFTASSSQGLAYMFEMLSYTAGSRFPVVMAIVNRAMAPPWNIWCDHQDSISCRDTGWIQYYVESAQEALDTVVQAFRVSEHPEVMTPAMVCLDAFVLSHTEEPVAIPSQDAVDAFLPPYNPPYRMDVENPMTFSAGAFPDSYMEFKYGQHLAFQVVPRVMREVEDDWERKVGRSYGGPLEAYRCEDAEVALVTVGTATGTARLVVDSLRESGRKAGLIKLRLFRPFPVEELRETARSLKAIGVLDRNLSFGFEGAVFSEVKAALYGLPARPLAAGFVAGLGGRDINVEQVEQMYDRLESASRTGLMEREVEFIGLKGVAV
ncbi:MAG: pyruvate ferredoxin oxidoreductase [Firmicutes bacterium]|nr:pyruvate ferredoxin oxidoreductase [Bacillota bacterium]